MNRPGATFARVNRWAAAHPFAVDIIFAAALGALAIVGYFSAEASGSEQPPDAIGLVMIIAAAAAFAWRRRSPLISLVLVSAATIAFWVSDYPTNFDPFSLLAVYAATAHGGPDRRRVWTVVGGVLLVLTAIATVGVLSPDDNLPGVAIVGIAVIHLTAAITGQVVYDRRRRLAELEQRATRAEAERELLARQAVLDERSRIARDLHDVVAHGMSVMVVQAGAAERVVANDPERASQALRNIQTTGREALSEMRRMLGVLRDDDRTEVELTPQPTLDDLDGVVRHCIEAGVLTELTIDGAPPQRAAGAVTAGYRIVQEALTNVVKHAGQPVRAAVKVTYRPDQIRLEVTDDGRGATTGDLEAATGHGLIGMRERVDVYSGSLHAGPRPGGGFRVSAVIPLAEGATA